MIAWEGQASWLSILAQMARDITTIGDAKVFVMVDTTSERTSASNQIANAGADMSRVSFHVRATDTIWMRDYGPRYIYLGTDEAGNGGVRAIVDHTYNRPRPNDNAIPNYWGALRNEPVYLIPLVHGGGNFHLESGSPQGFGHATRLIANENPSLSDAQIIQYWRDYQNLETTLYTPYPSFVDSTQHIDMWMIMLDDDKVMISEWVNEPTASWAITSDNTAAAFAARGFQVYRVPAVRSGGTHYTFTNAVICNDLVLVPSYTNSTASQFNDDALAVWQQAYPDKTIRQINCQAIVTSAGVMHCIVMHVPTQSNGDAPGVYMTTQNDGGQYLPGDLIQTDWLFDDTDVTTADLLLSTDGGQTFPITLATGFDGTSGSYYWQMPDIATTDARLRLVLHDAQGNTASDDSDASFTILGTPPCTADLAEPFGALNFFDITAYLDLYNAQDPAADLAAPFGTLNFFDITAYLDAYNAGCP
ncbi:MAG: hypothetical protein D6692_04320 [Planctomycetota bacterium]|nr:MAG: hypothetical protein D6692_04320 [Planctomycetota bacterium]